MWNIASVVATILSGLKHFLIVSIQMCERKNVAPDKENGTFLCKLLSQKVERLFSRGYYNGPPSYQHPYHGIGFDPLLLLAGLAFLALLLQTIHIIFYSKHAFSIPQPNAAARSEENLVQLADIVGRALHKYGNLYTAKKKATNNNSMMNLFFSMWQD